MPTDPFDFDPDDPEGGPPFEQLREAYKSLEKDLKNERKARESAERKITEDANARKAAAIEGIFTGLHLNPKDAEFFLLKNPDVEPTEEAVKAFAVERGWAPQAPPEPENESEQQQDYTPPQSFVPINGVLPPTQEISLQDFKTLYEKDPRRALGLVDQNLVANLPAETKEGQATGAF